MGTNTTPEPTLYLVYGQNGILLSGDKNIDDGMRAFADEHRGYIKYDGVVIYPEEA